MARLPAKDRRQVGTIAHPCGQTAAVFQNRRLHLYLNCPQCGHEQDNTAEAQTRIYRTMVPGETAFTPPRNLLPAAPAVTEAPKPVPEISVLPPADDQKPPAVAESGDEGEPPKPEPKTEKQGGGLGLLFIFLGLAGAAAAVLR